jgi:hypothetical protein
VLSGTTEGSTRAFSRPRISCDGHDETVGPGSLRFLPAADHASTSVLAIRSPRRTDNGPLDACVSIDAGADRVWQLIREPTLFIDLVAKDPPRTESRSSRLWAVDGVNFGSFLLRQVSAVEGRRAVYR